MLLRSSIPLVLAFLAVPSVALAQGLPDELTHLVTLVGNEQELVAAARRVHKQQLALVEWDQKLMARHQAEDQMDLAQIKTEDVRRRLQLVDAAWRYTLQHYPQNARANNDYGELLYDYLGRQGDAVRNWLLAVKVDDKLAPAHNNLGIHYMHIGVYDSGLTHLGKAVELDPKNPDFLFNLSQMYLSYFPELQRKYDMSKEKLYKEAMRLSAEAAKYAPNDFQILQDYATNFYAGVNFGVEVDWTKAAEAWKAARPYAPDNDDKYFTLINEGRAWLRAERPANALPVLEEALAIHPDSDVTKELIAQARAGQPAES